MDLTAVLLTGLLAGGVSCAAVQGGLLAALIARQRREPAREAVSPSGGPLDPATVPTEPGGQDGRSRTAGLSALGDDLVPVGGFLVGKLISHTALGALLGALGATVRFSVHVTAGLQILAGVLIIVFGLAQLGVPGFRRIVIEPPVSLSRVVLRSARSQAALAPGLLGLASILLPCGVTLSVEALALTSGSALSGAATMAVFVIGTSPLFTVLGYAARKAATAWRGRLAAATGIVLIVMGLFTLNGGFEVAGSPLAASRLAAGFASAPAPTTASVATPPVISNGRQTVEITATTDGYSPETIQARAGIPTTLRIRSDRAQGCVRSFTVSDRDVQRILPVNGVTDVDVGVLRPGTLDYACGMGMYTGTITAN